MLIGDDGKIRWSPTAVEEVSHYPRTLLLPEWTRAKPSSSKEGHWTWMRGWYCRERPETQVLATREYQSENRRDHHLDHYSQLCRWCGAPGETRMPRSNYRLRRVVAERHRVVEKRHVVRPNHGPASSNFLDETGPVASRQSPRPRRTWRYCRRANHMRETRFRSLEPFHHHKVTMCSLSHSGLILSLTLTTINEFVSFVLAG